MMTTRTAVQVFAAATHAVVEQRDVHDILARLLPDCLEVLDADAIGVLVALDDGELELLAATSHAVVELELYQIQTEQGPCQDVTATAAPVATASVDAIVERWGQVGEAIVRAGYRSVAAFPMIWQGRVLGGLNIFRSVEEPAGQEDGLGQAFADLIALLLVRSLDLSADDVSARVRAVIAGRAVIERAKGVLAYLEGVGMADAYDRLVTLAEARGATLTDTAEWLVDQAASRQTDDGADGVAAV